MKRFLWYFLLLLLAVWLGVVMHRNPGYVLLAYNNWSVETSLWFVVIVILIAFCLFYAVLRCSSAMLNIATWVSVKLSNRRARKAHKQTVMGLYDLAEGNWWQAERKLLRGAKHSDMPLINYLGAAYMAQRQHALERRDNYLRQAQTVIKNRPIAVGLTQARLQIGKAQWEEALATLQHLHHLTPKNAFILQLLEQVYTELQDWTGLKSILPDLRKRNAFSSEALSKVEQKVYYEILTASIKNGTTEKVWRELPRYLQKEPVLLAIYAEYLLLHHETEAAELVLKLALRKNLDPKLLELYAVLPSTKPIKQISRAEGWLSNHHEDENLLLCLGRLCKRQKLWGKARYYVEKSASVAPTATAYYELGQILEAQNDLRSAIDFYTKGLELCNTLKIASHYQTINKNAYVGPG